MSDYEDINFIIGDEEVELLPFDTKTQAGETLRNRLQLSEREIRNFEDSVLDPVRRKVGINDRSAKEFCKDAKKFVRISEEMLALISGDDFNSHSIGRLDQWESRLEELDKVRHYILQAVSDAKNNYKGNLEVKTICDGVELLFNSNRWVVTLEKSHRRIDQIRKECEYQENNFIHDSYKFVSCPIGLGLYNSDNSRIGLIQKIHGHGFKIYRFGLLVNSVITNIEDAKRLLWATKDVTREEIELSYSDVKGILSVIKRWTRT